MDKMDKMEKEIITNYVCRVVDNRPTTIPITNIVQKIMQNRHACSVLCEIQRCYEQGLSVDKTHIRIADFYNKQILKMLKK